MADAQAELAAQLAGVPLAAPAIPLACNGTGGWMDGATARDARYWAAHVATAVRWADIIDALASKAPALVLEVGGGGALAPLLAEGTADGADGLRTLGSLRHPRVPFDEGRADQRVFAEALGALWEAGVPVDWRAHHAHEGARPVT